jgi:phosphoribosylformylglycinamidine synthase
MRFGIVIFPGTWSDIDCYNVCDSILNQETEYIWHNDYKPLSGRFDCVILPGGFSYGDYLRPGAIARFSPVMESVHKFVDSGGLLFGICNGFQILCESGILPGTLMRNVHLQYRCEWTNLKVENVETPFSAMCRPGDILKIPISHGGGNFYADSWTLDKLESNGQVAFRYCDGDGNVTVESNPNGSINNIAGITNENGNVLGMMPHPERSCENILGSIDGLTIFQSAIQYFRNGR